MLHDVNCHREATSEEKNQQFSIKLDPDGSTVRYEVMKLCTGSLGSNGWYLVVLVQYRAVPVDSLCLYILKKWRFSQVSPIPHGRTDFER